MSFVKAAFWLFASTLQFHRVGAIPIDNGVIGLPLVDCQENRVSLVFDTERPFNGRIFVKGMANEKACRRTYPQADGASVVFEMTNGGCNMRRARRLGPRRGVEQSMTVIISFHSWAITKADRAYRCTCFFMEAGKVVTSQFEVSMLPTTDVLDTARMPLCTYQVRRGSISGPPVTYAVVGEEVYHVWECNSDMFGMLVHRCFVDDGMGQERRELLDDRGCAIDPVILPELTYNSLANMAYAEVHVFKFADKSPTYFQCAVSICMRFDGSCTSITPPHCHTRLTRDVNSNMRHYNADMDVVAERIVVLDLDLDDSSSEITDSELADLSSLPTTSPVCLTSENFGLLLSILLFVFLLSLLMVAVVYTRFHKDEIATKA